MMNLVAASQSCADAGALADSGTSSVRMRIVGQGDPGSLDLSALTEIERALESRPRTPAMGGALARLRAAGTKVVETTPRSPKMTGFAGVVRAARRSPLLEQKRVQAMLPSSPKKISSRHDIQVAYKSLYIDDTSDDSTTKQYTSHDSWDKPDSTSSSSRSKINQMKRKLRAAYAEKARRQQNAGLPTHSWNELFTKYDLDNSGSLDNYEFMRAMYRGASVSRREVPEASMNQIFASIDDDGNVRNCLSDVCGSPGCGKHITQSRRFPLLVSNPAGRAVSR